MRVTEYQRMQELMRGVQERSANLNALYEKLSTQKQVQRPSDDPVKAGTIMRTSSHLKELRQSDASIKSAQSFAEATSDALNAAQANMTSAKTLALKAANGTLSPENRRAVAEQLNQVIESLAEYANQRFEGRYVFSGTRTDTPPLSVQRDADGDIASVAYQGGTQNLEFPVGSNRRVPVSVTGQAAFFDSGVFNSLVTLRDHLNNTAGLSETDLAAALQSDVGAVGSAQQKMLAETGKFGSRTAELDALAAQSESAITRAQEVLSEASDVDMAQVAVDLQREQTIYQAMLSAGSKIMKTTLIDYL